MHLFSVQELCASFLLCFLCDFIPLSPDDVLWKGSVTLCEMQAREKGIVAPNKPECSAIEKITRDGSSSEYETYFGGHA